MTEGFFDTGNLLMDPLENLPVCLVTRSMGRRLLREAGEEDDMAGLRWISFCGPTGEKGIMPVIRPEELLIHDGGTVRSCRVVLAFVPDDAGAQPWGENVGLLLHGWLMDGAFAEEKKVGKDYETIRHHDPFQGKGTHRRYDTAASAPPGLVLVRHGTPEGMLHRRKRGFATASVSGRGEGADPADAHRSGKRQDDSDREKSAAGGLYCEEV